MLKYFFLKISRFFYYRVFPADLINIHMGDSNKEIYAEMYAYLKESIHNLNTVMQLYSDSPEEALRQSRTILSTAKQRVTEFEESHSGGVLQEPARPKAYKLDMKKQLFGGKSDDRLLT